MTVVIEQISPHHPKARALLAAASAAMDNLYPPTSQHGLDPKEAEQGIFMIAWQEGEAAGCGVIRPLVKRTGEIKRMFVSPTHRRQGIARKILTELEAMAPRLGLDVIRLETGTLQPEAITLYESAGYRQIERYGEYTNDPLSVCFEKNLSAKIG